MMVGLLKTLLVGDSVEHDLYANDLESNDLESNDR